MKILHPAVFFPEFPCPCSWLGEWKKTLEKLCKKKKKAEEFTFFSLATFFFCAYDDLNKLSQQ